jgi:GrpB-like predicted nucleotidyltransferase (UPF0157 family)
MHRKEIIGRRKNVFVFKRYSSIYKSLFRDERTRLYTGIGKKSALIEHVGSTAVPGLGGKNILDIAVGIRVGTLKDFKKQIEDLGYDFIETGGTQRRLFFIKYVKYKGKNIQIHLHLVKFNGPDWIRHVAFRDYLIKHKNAMLEYAKVKRRAVKVANGDKKIYMKEKDLFIREIMKKALESRSRKKRIRN